MASSSGPIVSTPASLEILPPPPRRAADWPAAARALRGLVADPTQTPLVFELMDALGGPDGEPWFQRFLRDPEGRRLLVSQRDLAEALCDRPALARLPTGSLGRAYLAHLDRFGLDPIGVVAAQRRAAEERGLVAEDPVRRWFFDRVELMHDLWHVLTGYGADEMGEAALLAFSEAQMHTRGILLLVATAALLGPKGDALAWQRYLVRAFRRGRRAAPLHVVAWEELLPRPVADVRRALRIAPPEVAHPEGVRAGPLFTRTRRTPVAA